MKDQTVRIWLSFNVVILVLGGSACAEQSVDRPIEERRVDSQEYIDEAYACVYLFERLGEKRMSQLSLANIMWSFKSNSDLEHVDPDSMIKEIEAQIAELESLFKDVNVTKREIIFYLVSNNSCLTHVGMGGVGLLLNESED